MNYGDVIAKGHKQDLLLFEQFGSYQGDFIVITKDSDKAYIYKDSYGSCGGCDSLEAFEDYCDDSDKFWTQEKCEEFAKDYQPFITVDLALFHQLLKDKKLFEIMPANTRLDFNDRDYNDLEDKVVFEKLQEQFLNPTKDED